MLGVVGEYVQRRHWVVFSLVALFSAVDFGRWLFAPGFVLPSSGPAVDLAFGLAVELIYIAMIFSLLNQRDFFGYSFVAALLGLGLFSAAMNLVVFIVDFGMAYSFGDPRHAIVNCFRIGVVLVSIPALIAVLALWWPLYRKRVERHG